MNGEKILYQEILMEINVTFSEWQSNYPKGKLEKHIVERLHIEFTPHEPEPMDAEEVNATNEKAYIKIRAAVNWFKDEPDISNFLIKRVKKLLPMEVSSVELISLKEEAEIYGNK